MRGIFVSSRFAFGKKIICSVVAWNFMFSMVLPPSYAQQILLPGPGQAVFMSPGFEPTVLKGMTVHPENPLLFDFIVDRGEQNVPQETLKKESTKLVKYFLTALTVPDQESWVNLSPTEKDRIIPDTLGQTEMGQTMLEQDYILKQLSASLTSPNTNLGRTYWAKVGNGRDRSLQDLTKVWIVPDGATVVEKDGFAYILKSHLKVMMQEDYENMSSPRKRGSILNTDAKMDSRFRGNDLSNGDDALAEKALGTNNQEPSSDVFRTLILPQIEKEVNEGKNFAPTRQVYQSVVLAAWYKKALKESLLSKIYVDKAKMAGVDTADKDFKNKVYEQYLAAFKRGVYNIIKEEAVAGSDETVPRKYFSGGNRMAKELVIIKAASPTEIKQAEAIVVANFNAGHDFRAAFQFEEPNAANDLQAASSAAGESTLPGSLIYADTYSETLAPGAKIDSSAPDKHKAITLQIIGTQDNFVPPTEYIRISLDPKRKVFQVVQFSSLPKAQGPVVLATIPSKGSFTLPGQFSIVHSAGALNLIWDTGFMSITNLNQKESYQISRASSAANETLNDKITRLELEAIGNTQSGNYLAGDNFKVTHYKVRGSPEKIYSAIEIIDRVSQNSKDHRLIEGQVDNLDALSVWRIFNAIPGYSENNKRRILIVTSDSKAASFKIKETIAALLNEGYRVVLALSHEQANQLLQRSKEDQFSLVYTEDLPNGAAFLHQIQENFPGMIGFLGDGSNSVTKEFANPPKNRYGIYAPNKYDFTVEFLNQIEKAFGNPSQRFMFTSTEGEQLPIVKKLINIATAGAESQDAFIVTDGFTSFRINQILKEMQAAANLDPQHRAILRLDQRSFYNNPWFAPYENAVPWNAKAFRATEKMATDTGALGLTQIPGMDNAWGLNLGSAKQPRWANYEELIRYLIDHKIIAFSISTSWYTQTMMQIISELNLAGPAEVSFNDLFRRLRAAYGEDGEEGDPSVNIKYQLELLLKDFEQNKTNTDIWTKKVASSSSPETDAKYGGINFDPTKLDLQIKRDGKGVPLPLPQQNLENINIKGLYPIMINFQIMTAVPPALSMGQNSAAKSG